MGEVYLARDLALDRNVALKLLPRKFVEDAALRGRFEKEARAVSTLNHPNIVTIHEIADSDEGRFIVMEYVKGRTLRTLMGEGLNSESALAFCTQIVRAVETAHDAGIVHRDLKPENIMVRDDGYVKVLDFGLARLTAAGLPDLDEGQTTPGTLIGTTRYMSPEQAQGLTAQTTTDIFSLGILFYELMTGQHPFDAESAVTVLHKIITVTPSEAPLLNSGIPRSIATVVMRMLDKDPGLRPECAEILEALEDPVSSIGIAQERAPAPGTDIVGREGELSSLREASDTVSRDHQGLLVGVAGEAGIGKTTLVEDFLSDLGSRIARGRCSERLGLTAAYLPILEALRGLLRGNDTVAPVMRSVAPTWYLQIAPPLEEDKDSGIRLNDARASSQERMKWELSAFLEEIVRSGPLTLFLDDVQWADVSTIDVLAYLSARFDELPILILCTFRTSDMLISNHPFLQLRPDLMAHGKYREVSLNFFGRSDVQSYLDKEFPDHAFPADLTDMLHKRTEGNPLFIANLTTHLIETAVISKLDSAWVLTRDVARLEKELPESIRAMIRQKIDRLGDEDLQLLLAASVQGHVFDSAVIAKVLSLDEDVVEDQLEALERLHGLVQTIEESEFPDGTPTLRCRFVHVLYQNAFYSLLGPARRRKLSSQVADALRSCYGKETDLIVSELAHLLQIARDHASAAEYFSIAAKRAASVFANAEAAILARRGLESLESLPETPDRALRELELQLTLGFALTSTKGYADPETGERMDRARELCESLGETHSLLPAIWGLCSYYMVKADLKTARRFSEQLIRLGTNSNDTIVLVGGHYTLGTALYLAGELSAGHEHYEKVISLHDIADHRKYRSVYRRDPGLYCRAGIVRTFWLLGYPDQASRRVSEVLALSNDIADPGSLAFVLMFPIYLSQFCGKPDEAEAHANTCIDHCKAQGVTQELIWASIIRGWAMAERGRVAEGISEMRDNLAKLRSARAEVFLPYFIALLAEALFRSMQFEESMKAVAEALAVVDRNGERYYEAELYRLRGELLLKECEVRTGWGFADEADDQNLAEAAGNLEQAVRISRRQNAKSLELRATISLSRLWRSQGRGGEAYRMLFDVYDWFTEGFQTHDLQEARELLTNLEGES